MPALYRKQKWCTAHTTRLKRALAAGDLPAQSVILLQDFTQIDLKSGFIQDLMICAYTHDPMGLPL